MDAKVGQTAQRTLTVTAESVELFAQVFGDRNRLHFDADWTARTRFGRLLAQGGIATGLLHTLVALDLPGPAPVHIGATITAHAEITWVHASKPIARMDFRVVNQDADPVLTGEATVYQASPED